MAVGCVAFDMLADAKEFEPLPELSSWDDGLILIERLFVAALIGSGFGSPSTHLKNCLPLVFAGFDGYLEDGFDFDLGETHYFYIPTPVRSSHHCYSSLRL